MPKYLFMGSYTPEGLKGLMSEGGTGRVEAAKKALKSAGGKLEAFFFAFGGDDFYIIADLPDDATTMAVSWAGNASGTLSMRTVALLTPKEVDEAATKTIAFRPPGH